MSDLKKVISIELDDKTKTGLDGIDKTFKDVDKSINGAEKTSQNLRLELKQLKNDLLSGKFTGDEFTEATRKAGELKDSVGDLNARINVLSSDTKNLDGLVSAATGLAAGFSVAQGAAGLLGSENEDLQKSILKVQSATAILNGLTEISNQLQSESKTSILLTSAAEKVSNFVKYGSITATEAQTAATVEATVATKGLRVALLSTGIGAIVIAVIALVAAFNEYGDSVEKTKEKQDKFNKEMEKSKELLNDELGALEYNTQVAILLAKKRGASEEELRAIEKKGYEERIKEIDKLLYSGKLSADETKKLGDEKLALYRSNTLKELQNDVDREDKKRDINKKSLEDSKKNDEKRHKDYLSGIDDYIKSTKDSFIKQHELINNDNNLTLKEKKDFNRKISEADAADKKALADKQLVDDMKSAEEAITILNDLRDAQETPAQREERLYLHMKAVLEANNLSTEELTRQHLKKLSDINLTNQDSMLAELNTLADKDIQIDKDKQEQKDKLKEAELKTADATVGFLKNIAGKNKGLQRAAILAESALGIGKSIIAMNTANAEALATPQAVATSGAAAAPTIAFNTATAALSVAGNIAATARALKELGGGGAAGGAGTGAGGSGAGPQAQFNIVGQSSNNQLAQTIAGKQGETVKAFVVGSDVTTQQALDRNKINNSTFL